MVIEQTIADEIAAYDRLRQQLEAEHTGEWALVKDQTLVRLFDSFESAAEDAVNRFGRGRYLIRQIGAPPVVLPASVMYQFENGPLRIHG